MFALSRRSFLASSVAVAAHPALAIPASSGIDIIVVGAGAAGIAARRIAAAGGKLAIFEATDRLGGRCFTETRTFGMPYDPGAHWIHMPDLNPLVKLASKTGLDIYPAPPGQRLRITRRNAREGEMEDFLANLVRCNRAIYYAARGRTDVSCAQALPKDLGDWRATMEFVLGPFACGKDLDEVSAMDVARIRGTQRRRLLPRGGWHVAGQARCRAADPIFDAGEGHRLGWQMGGGPDRKGRPARPRSPECLDLRRCWLRTSPPPRWPFSAWWRG
jgi:choline dehydrogenase-like flavoprotein